MANGRRVTVVIRPVVNAMYLQLECARVLHEILLLSVLMYRSETMLWRKVRNLELGLNRWITLEDCRFKEYG